MMTLNVKIDQLKKDYPNFYKFFKDSLLHSNSKYKDYKESKYKCSYYVGFYMLKSQKTKEYYNNLYSLLWEDRLKEEYKKIRVSITVSVGKFMISDQTNELNETVNSYIKEIVSRKIYYEQMNMDETDTDVLNSIPDLDILIEKIDEETKHNQDFIEQLSEKLGISYKKGKELTSEDKLKKLIDDEKYEEADQFLIDNPDLKNKK